MPTLVLDMSESAAQKRYRLSEKGKKVKAAYMRKWAKSPQGQKTRAAYKKTDKAKMYKAAWEKTKKGKVMRARAKKRYMAKPESRLKAKIAEHTRRAKVSGLPHTLTAERWLSICEEYNHRCAYCMKQSKLTQDHIVPVKKGGGYTEGNIVPACLPCNSSKKDTSLLIWMASQYV